MNISKVALKGATLAAVGFLLVGCTGTASSDKNPVAVHTDVLYADLGETSGAWLDTVSSNKQNLAVEPKLVTNMAGTCSYTIFYPKMKVEGDIQQVTDNHLKQLAKNDSAKISTKDLKSEGQDKVAKFSITTALSEGKSKTSYLHYIEPNSLQDGEALSISLAYSCNTEREWSEAELDGLLEVTTVVAKEAEKK